MQINNSVEQERYNRALERVKKIKGFYTHLAVYVIVNIFLFMINFQSFNEFFNFNDWRPFNTAFFWGIGLAIHWFSVFGPNLFLGKNWEEKKIKELMDKDQKQWE